MVRNIVARRKLEEALANIDSPFSSRDISDMTGITPGRVAALLKEVEGLDRIPVARRTGARINYKFSGGSV